MPKLREVRIIMGYFQGRHIERPAWSPEELQHYGSRLEAALNSAICCGAVTRAIEEAWTSGAVVLKKTGAGLK